MQKICVFLCLYCLINVHGQSHLEVLCNRNYYPRVVELLRQAKQSIHIVGLVMKSTSKQVKKIIKLLKNAKKRDVDVRVFLEGDYGSVAPINQRTLMLLRKAGIAGRSDSRNRITHAKLLVIDDYVILGSTNLTYNSMSNNNESNLLIHDKFAAKFYRQYAEHLWQNPQKNWNLQHKTTDGTAIYFTDASCMQMIAEAIDSATKEIQLMMYMVKRDKKNPAHPVSQLLQKLVCAKRRGIDVRLVLESTKRKAFNSHIYLFNKDAAFFLRKNGVTDIAFDDPGQITHCKILLIDKRLIILGSNNWYAKGLMSSHQVGIATRDKATIQKFYRYFETISKYCQ